MNTKTTTSHSASCVRYEHEDTGLVKYETSTDLRSLRPMHRLDMRYSATTEPYDPKTTLATFLTDGAPVVKRLYKLKDKRKMNIDIDHWINDV